MNSNTAYTVVAIAPLEIQKKFNAIKKKINLFQSETKDKENHIILKNTAHFAIKRTFFLKEGVSEKKLVQKLDGLSLPKIAIKCEESGIFKQSNYGTIVFVKVNLEKELIALHSKIKLLIDTLIETINPEYEGESWSPHITFMYNTPTEKTLEIRTIIDKELLPIGFTLNKLHLLREYNTEKDERKVLKIFYSSNP